MIFMFDDLAPGGQSRTMPKTTPTVAEFSASLPDDRRDTVTTVHKAGRETSSRRPAMADKET